MNRGFFDTNVLVYAFSDDRRGERARGLLELGGTIGVQSLNEFVNVALNKLKMSWSEIDDALAEIELQCDVGAPLTLGLHRSGLAITKLHRLRIYDALIIAAALETRCNILWSEDMQDGMIVHDCLQIRNPFARLH